MSFKSAPNSTLCQPKKVNIVLAVDVICPKCGSAVKKDEVVSLHAHQTVQRGDDLDGYAVATPCCYAVVSMDVWFHRWLGYQYVSHKCQPEVTDPMTEQGVICDVREGVEQVSLVTE